MKKLVSILLVCILVFGLSVIPVSARKADVDVEKYLHEHILAFEEKIDVSDLGFKTNEIMDIVNIANGLFYKYADLFYYGGVNSYSYLGDDITEISVEYTYDYKDVEFVRNYAQSHYLSKVDDNWSDLEKIVFIHDALAVDFQYDVRLYDVNEYMNVARDIYGMFTCGQGVCQAYSNTFMYLMQELGIECKLVATDTSNHEWNVVKLDGEWYHVDVTQNDPVYAITSTTVSSLDLAGNISHRYFLLSDKSINDKHLGGDHYEWDFLDDERVECKSEKYLKNYDFSDALTAFVPIGGKWYFIEEDGSELEFEITDDFMQDEDLFAIPAEWAADDDMAYWPGSYTGLYSAGDWLVYNTDVSVSAINVKNKKKMVLYTLDDIKTINTSIPQKAHIYGSKLKDGKIYCQISLAPVDTEYYTVLLDLCGDEHKSVSDWITVKKATHEEEGLREKVCEFCGETIESEVLPKIEHRLVRNPLFDKNATCSEPAKKAYKCMNFGCDYTEYRDEGEPVDHKWAEDKENSIEPTEETEGVKAYKCIFGCGETKTEVIPVLGTAKPGDVNGDGGINAGDLALLKKGLAGAESIIVKFFDCNGDGTVNAADLAVLKKFLAGLISVFG